MIFRDPSDETLHRELLEAERKASESRWRPIAKSAQEIEQEKRQLRDEQPKDYKPPTTPHDLLERYGKGERYFPNTSLSGGELNKVTFEYANFKDADFKLAKLNFCNFKNCDFQNADADTCIVFNTSFEACIVEGMKLRGATLEVARFANCKLSNVDLSSASLDHLTLDRCSDLPDTFKLAKGLITARLVDCTFTGADLSGANLSHVDLAGCSFASADFSDADLSDSNLSGTTLTGAKFLRTRLKSANLQNTVFAGSTLKLAVDLPEIKWRGANLSNCDLSGMNLVKFNLSGVTARNADFSNCNLENADLSKALLNAASFKSANLRYTTWQDAVLNAADFEGADLRYAKNIWFDQNNLYTARLSPKGGDAWTQLRREYSGSRLAFHMLILVAFFLPYVIRAAAWTQVNNAQLAHAAALQEIQSDPSKRRAMEAATAIFPELSQVATSKCLAPKCKEWRIWELLLARDAIWYSQVLAWLLIVYNLARFYLTWQVGPLRDDEDRTYVTPARSDYLALFGAHRLVQVVFYVSIVSFAFHAYDALFNGIVSLPK
jgi:uncharacterized protein YjbI with pentapeptide repeats